MPKITNWTSTSDLSWKNDKTEAQLTVFDIEDAEGNTRWAFSVQQENELSDTRPYSHSDFSTREDAVNAARDWMENNPYGGKDRKSYTEEERHRLVDTIVGVRTEENRNRSSGDRLTSEEIMDFKELLHDKSDGRLEDMWFEWVGEWLGQRDEYWDEVEEQFQKTLRGEHDYGFV